MDNMVLKTGVSTVFNGAQPLRLEKVVLDETRSSEGREISAGQTWESETFSTDGLSQLSYFTSLNKGIPYSVKVVEKIGVGGELYLDKDTHIIVPEGISENVNGRINIHSPAFKVIVENHGSESFMIGLYLFLSRGGD